MSVGIPRMTSVVKKAQCLAVVVWTTLLLQTCSAFNLDGRPGSYAKFPSWEPCLNGSFSFEFKTDSPNALLVYLDHGKFKFFELKMVGGSLRLRVNLAEGTVIVRAGEKLDDSDWHRVEVSQDQERTILSVDGAAQSRTAPGKVTAFTDGSSDKEIFMFFGGLPKEYDNQLLLLALPSVVFEPRFKGSIRNLFFRDCGAEPHRPDMVDSFGLRSMDVDFCERGNPCLNGGVCLTTDDGLMCDCAKTEYRGERCDIEKVPSDSTFFGAQYLSYNLSSRGNVLDSNQDQVSLDFRTKQADGLLFYTGNKKDYLNIAIKDGAIVLTINLGSGSFEKMVPKDGTPRLDDNRWHHVVVRREAREISMEVDGIHRETGSTTGKYTLLSSKLLYVAGSPDTATLPGSRVRTNFKGCMRKVRYKADSVEMDLTELARSQHPLLKVSGDVIYDKCQELAESRPITFTTPQSYLIIPTWDQSRDKGTLAFQFQTVEQNGLLMYSTGASEGNQDFLALELVDGYLNLVMNQGSEPLRVICRGVPVSDGRPHNVYLEFHNNRGYVTVDGQKETFASLSHLDRFDLGGSLSIGGVNKHVDATRTSLPRELWVGMLGDGYVGCLLDMVLDGNKIDLVTAAQMQGVAGVAEYCQTMEPHCLSHPCMHNGVCVEGWNRFTCDCRATGFIDSVCQTAAATLQFDGTQFVKVTQPEESQTQAEEISMRFRTMHPNGLLFMTTSDVTNDRMELYLENGVIYLGVNVGSGKKLLSVGHMLNDDRWHTVYIKRRGHEVELKIDVLRPVAEKLPGTEITLSVKAFFIGYPSVTKSLPAEISRRAAQFDFRRVDIGHVLQDDNKLSTFNGFIGSMQQFIFNDNLFFEMARTGQMGNIQLTARLSSEGYVVADPVTFKNMDAFAVLPRLQAHDKFSVSFQLKTTESDGLLLFNAGKGQDFFAMELTSGFLYYVYNMGGGTQRIRANINEKLNDNRWHEIRLLRSETYKQLLRVDNNTPTVDDLSGAKAIHFDLQEHLYLGGVKKTMYHTLPKKIEARHGYIGCIGSLDLNGYLPNILREASPVHEAVGDGCQGPTSQCVNDSCANGGRCVQQWSSVSCDCDMTSYTGPKCQQESVAYKFGPGVGVLTFTHPAGSLPATTRDNLALGFRTRSENAVLVRIDSNTFTDYIELELVKGKVYAFYNMGTRDYPIGEMFQKLNDGKYHVVRFTRAGPNTTIQVDDLMMQVKTPRVFYWETEETLEPGQQAHTFNNQAYVFVGGRKERNGTIVKPFQGTMAGLVVNGKRILDLAKDNDDSISREGDVSLVSNEQGQKQKGKKDKGKDDTSDMQSTMGVGLRTTGLQSKISTDSTTSTADTTGLDQSFPIAVTYHFKLTVHARNSSVLTKAREARRKHRISPTGPTVHLPRGNVVKTEKPSQATERPNFSLIRPNTTAERRNEAAERSKQVTSGHKQSEERSIHASERRENPVEKSSLATEKLNHSAKRRYHAIEIPSHADKRPHHAAEKLNQSLKRAELALKKSNQHHAVARINHVAELMNHAVERARIAVISSGHARNRYKPATERRIRRHRNRRRRHFGNPNSAGKRKPGFESAAYYRQANWVRRNTSRGRSYPEQEWSDTPSQRVQIKETASSPVKREIVIVDSAEIFAGEALAGHPYDVNEGSFPPSHDDDDHRSGTANTHEIFSYDSTPEIFSNGDNDRSEEEGQETSSEAPRNEYKCSFSDTSGNMVTLGKGDLNKNAKKKKDNNGEDVESIYDYDDDDDDDDDDAEGSGRLGGGGGGRRGGGGEGEGETPNSAAAEDVFSNRHFELVNANFSGSSARLALLSSPDGDGENAAGEDAGQTAGQRRRTTTTTTTTTTVILPFVIPEGATMSANLHMTVTPDGTLIDWDHMTTPLNGVTDDIIFSGAGPGCPYDDEEDCTVQGSGTDDDIIKPTVVIKTTPPPPTTTTRRPLHPNNNNNNQNQHHNNNNRPGHPDTGGILGHQTDFFLSTPDPPGGAGNGGKDEMTIKPSGDTDKTLGAGGGSSLNIGLIVGIAVSVLVAVVILCIALYKFRSRDEGTYKVDESQNFTTLDGKKSGSQGNGTLLSHSDNGKRGGKKKAVKEWYV